MSRAPSETTETLKRYFEHLFANSRDIMNLFSMSEGKVIMLNAAAHEATGYSLAELQQLSIDALYPAEEHPKLMLAFERLRDTGFSSDKLCMYVRNGELRDIWTRSYVVQREPEPICIVHTIDVTEENRKRERELRDAKLATLGEASATLAHELKNALQSMQFSLSTLRMQLSQSGLERVAGSLTRLERAAAHMDDVICGIEKSTSQQQSGSLHISVAAAVHNAVALMQGYLLAKDIAVSTEFGHALPLVRCNQAHLEQILVVLIKNAAQAMASRPERRLRLSVMKSQDHLRIDVADTGGGLLPSVEATLFDAFKTSKPAGLGQGLGLANARQLAQENDLELGFSSVPGVGTTFSIGFRRSSEPEVQESLPLAGRMVLVVGDDPALVETLMAVLVEAGSRVLHAPSASEAVQLLRVHAVSAVVCDDAMFPVQGLAFVAQARALYRGPICLVVNYRYDHAPEALPGVSSVLTKPIQERALVTTLNALLA
jgi:PAS domain S-box-containing protein